MSGPSGFAPRSLIAALADADVEFCVVGAFALAVHGAPRGTADVDIAAAASIENLTKLADALTGLEGRVEPGGGVEHWSAELLGSRGEIKAFTVHGPLHVLTDVEGVPAFDRLKGAALAIDVEGREVLFAGRDDLIEMKKRSGRLIDRADLDRLADTEEDPSP